MGCRKDCLYVPRAKMSFVRLGEYLKNIHTHIVYIHTRTYGLHMSKYVLHIIYINI